MSSLYDQFFSETNINHIYNVLSDIIEKEYSYNIKIDFKNLDIFKTKMKKIFTDTQQINLNEINKELLTEMITYFQHQHQYKNQDQNYDQYQNQNQNHESFQQENIIDEYNKFMSERDAELNYGNKEQIMEPKIESKMEPKIESKMVVKNEKRKIRKNIIVSSKDRNK